MNRIVIIIIAVLVIAVAGGAVWYFFTQADAPIEGQEEEKASLEALEFVDIENLSIPVIREGRVDRYITISVSLEMRDQDSKELGDEAFPRLKDAVFSQLYSYFSMQQSGQSGINIAQVKARLLWAASASSVRVCSWSRWCTFAAASVGAYLAILMVCSHSSSDSADVGKAAMAAVALK